MAMHADKTCCLAGKANEKVDLTWLVDPKTKGVANVVIWLKAPPGTSFPIHEKFKVRKEIIEIDQPHCAFLPRVAVYNPYYMENGKKVPTGQQMLMRNSSTVNHNIRAVGHPDKNPGFNVNVPAGGQLDVTKKNMEAQVLPVNINCDIHPWMAAKLFVFDHPYYAITKADGSFEIPYVPAGAEVNVMGWHEGKGWVLEGGKKGQNIQITSGKNELNIEFKAPPTP
jgi:hypothetical protein